MNKIFNLLVLLILVLFSSCEKEGLTRIGFDAGLNGSTSGTTVMNVTEETGSLWLEGTVKLTGGELLVELVEPSGSTAYTRTFNAPVEADIDESFNSEKGNWTLKYSCTDAGGSIDLHLNK